MRKQHSEIFKTTEKVDGEVMVDEVVEPRRVFLTSGVSYKLVHS